MKWEAIIPPSHKLSKSTQILTEEAADWYRICSSVFQQYVNMPYLISGQAIHSVNKHSREVSGISNYSSVTTESKSSGDIISKINRKSFSTIQVHTC